MWHIGTSQLSFPAWFCLFSWGTLFNGWIAGLGCFLLAGVGRTFLFLNSTFCINSICHL